MVVIVSEYKYDHNNKLKYMWFNLTQFYYFSSCIAKGFVQVVFSISLLKVTEFATQQLIWLTYYFSGY